MINLSVVENPSFFPPKLDPDINYRSYFVVALSGFEARDKAVREIFRRFGTQNYERVMVFIYDPFQRQHGEVKMCFRKDDETPLQIPAFIVTPRHPNTWDTLPKKCVRVNRGLISRFLKEEEGEMHLFDLINDLFVFCYEGKFEKATQDLMKKELLLRIKSVWKEARSLVGVSFTLI